MFDGFSLNGEGKVDFSNIIVVLVIPFSSHFINFCINIFYLYFFNIYELIFMIIFQEPTTETFDLR